MKYTQITRDMWQNGRPPHGGRGLKYQFADRIKPRILSPPARGAWIEMIYYCPNCGAYMSPPARGAWIEILKIDTALNAPWSPPARGAWIEI